MLVLDNVRVEEERSTGKSLCEKIGGEEREPLEDAEARARLEHEHRNGLLQGEADDDSRPRLLVSTEVQKRIYEGRHTMGCASGAWKWPRSRTGRRKVQEPR